MDNAYKRRIPGHSETSEIVALNFNPTSKVSEDKVTLNDSSVFTVTPLDGRREFMFQLLSDGYVWFSITSNTVTPNNGMRIGGNGSIFGMTLADKTEAGIPVPLSFTADTGNTVNVIIWQMGV